MDNIYKKEVLINLLKKIIVLSLVVQMSHADTLSAGAYLNKLLSTSANPNSEVQILDTKFILKYDEFGMPGSVLTDGKVLTISEFLDTDEIANYLGIKNGEGSKSYIPKGKSNTVPEDFNGEVFVSACFDPQKCNLTAEGGPNFLADIPAISGGAFDRVYNGISGSVPVSDPLISAEYDLKNLTLASSIWGISDVGQKYCRPSREKFPNSAANWWFVLKNYIQAEKFRNEIHAARVKDLQDRVSSETSSNKNSDSKEYQLKAMISQIDLYNLEIDSISGSSLYSGGELAQKNREMSRIAWRETILGSVYQGIVDSKKEDEIVLAAYNQCANGINESLNIATKSCEEFKKNCDTKNEDCEDAKNACEMKNQNIPLFKKVAISDIITLYTGAPIPSKVLNEKFNNIFHFMNFEVDVFFPKPKSKKYGDWISPLNSCLNPLKNAILDNGLICPSNVADTDYDKDKFVSIGRTSDLIGSVDHYTAGEKNVTSSPSYANSNNVYNDSMKAYKVANPNSSEDEQKRAGLRALWLTWINSAYSKNFLADKPLNEGLDPKEEEAYAKKVMVENNLTSTVCTQSTCMPAIVVDKPNITELESPVKVTESAKNFLTSMGVSSDETTVKFLEKNWNLIDMYLGQSHMRQVYFKTHMDLLTKLIESDRYKLSTLLVERQKLIDAYNKFKKILENSSSNSNVILGGGSTGRGSTKIYKVSGQAANAISAASDSTESNTSNENADNKGSNSTKTSSYSASIFASSGGLLSISKKSTDLKANKSVTTSANVGSNNSSGSFSVSANSKISKLNKGDNLKSLNYTKVINLKNLKEEASLEARSSQYDKKLVAINNPSILKTGFAKSVLGDQDTNKNGEVKVSEDFQLTTPNNVKGMSNKLNSNTNFSLPGTTYSKANYKNASMNSKMASKDSESNDQKKLNEAIDASKYDKSKTERSNFDSIFDQITKAYIRNYEKVK